MTDRDYAQRFEELKRYVRFSDRDAEVLAELREHAAPHFNLIATEFYERAREHEQAHAVFQDEAQIARLHETLVAWLDKVLSGPYDAAYCEKSARIGRVHVRVGLPQRYMFSAMTLFRLRLQEVAEQTLGDGASRACKALSRVLDLELAIMNETYAEAMIERAERLERDARSQQLNALARTERRYVRAVEIAGALIIGLDGDGCIQLFNREAEKVTGYTQAEILGESFAQRLVYDDCDFDEVWRRGVSARRPMVVPTRCALRTRSGKVRDVAGQVSRADDDDDVMVILAGRDVTEENARAARARQTEKLAAVGTMAAGLAHEIRNPLNGAQLHLTFLERALDRNGRNGELREAATVVSSEIARLSALVTEFLDFARPSELRREPTSIQKLCRHAVSVLQGQTGAAPVDLQLPTTEIVADIDPAKIQQVLLNLLQNALEAASAASDGRVGLKAYREPRAALIEVRDDGAGLAPEAPIFDAFYSTKAEGTGLGLTIAHRIVDDHCGRIEVESAPGDTVFRVRLPLESPERTPSEAPTSAGEADGKLTG